MALPCRVGILALNGHRGTVTQHPLDHGRDLRGGAALQLRVNAGGPFIRMPVDRHARFPIAGMVFGDEILIPDAVMLGIRGAGRGYFAPDLWHPYSQRGVHHALNRFPEGIFVDKTSAHIDLSLTVPRYTNGRASDL